MIYRCKVIDSNGNIESINIFAINEVELEKNIIKKNKELLSFTNILSLISKELSKNQILTFTQTIKLLIESNLTLVDSLETSLQIYNDKHLIDFTKKILVGLKSGMSFSQVLSENNKGFSELFIGLIRVGEKTGTLKVVINQLYNYLDRNKKLKEKLLSAMIYPIFVLLMTICFSILFMTVLLPKFTTMFTALGGGLGDTLDQRASVLFLLLIIFISLVLFVISIIIITSKIKLFEKNTTIFIEKLYLKLPFIGKFILNNETFNIIFALSVLTKSSLNLEESLTYGKNVINNDFLKKEVELILDGIKTGKSLSNMFLKTIFPKKVSSFIRVSEKTGDISTIFDDLSKYYLKESNKTVDRVMIIMDPIITLLLGIIILLLILFFIIPVLTQLGEVL